MNTDKQQIEELLTTRIEAAWNAGDAKAFASLFTADADYIVFFGQHYSGRAQIESEHAAVFAGPLKGSRLFSTLKGVRFLAPNVAVAHGEGTTTQGAQSKPPASRNSIQTYVVVKDDRGKWLISAFQNTRIRQDWLFKLMMRFAGGKKS